MTGRTGTGDQGPGTGDASATLSTQTIEEARNRHALAFVRQLEEHFKGEFDHEHLNMVWPQILACHSKAFGVAVWHLKRNHKRLPTIPALLQMIQAQQRRLFPPPSMIQEITPVPMPEHIKEWVQLNL